MGLVTKLFRKQDIRTLLKEAQAENDSGNGLRKVLTVTDLIAFGISSTLGSGIFVTVGTMALQYTGPSIYLSFVVAGLCALMSALCYAEFASRVPLSGQGYTYAYVSLGELVAFVTGWLGFVSYSIATAAVARGWANYLDSFLKAVCGVHLPRYWVSEDILLFSDFPWSVASVSLLAALLNIACTVLACFNISESARVSKILVMLNFSLMVGFSLYGSIMYGDVDLLLDTAQLPFGVTGVFRGAGLAFFCCIGWELLCTFSEEVKHPARDLPRGIIGSLSAATLLYCGVAVTLAVMVPWQRISKSAPIAEAFKYHHDHAGMVLISFVCSTVCPPSVLTGIVGPPRMLYKMSKDGLLFEWLGSLNRYGAPVAATVLGGVFAALLGGLLDFEYLASSCSSSCLIMFAIVCIGVVIVRYNEGRRGVLSPAAKNGILSLPLILSLFVVSSVIFSKILLDVGFSDCPVLWSLAAVFNGVSAVVVVYVYRGSLSRRSSDLVLSKGVPLLVQPNARENNIFLCPLMPILPLCGAWVDILLVVSLGLQAVVGIALMVGAGLVVYFGYGIHHSRLAV